MSTRFAPILLLLPLSVCCSSCDPAPARPDIILVTSDTLRADHLSVNGYGRNTSPNIDAFAARSTHFTDAITVIPKTGPAFATIFTGLHSQQHGVRSNFDSLPPSVPTLAERLSELGYRTAAFVGNPVLRPAAGFGRGFDHYELFDGKREDAVQSVNTAYFAWIARSGDEPSFVWIHYMDPHGPYTPPEEFEKPFIDDALARSDVRVPPVPTASVADNPNKVLGTIPAYQRQGNEDRLAVYVARYDAEIRYMDNAFGELIGHLEREGRYDESAIVFTADHGESLGEHDYYFEHGWYAFEPTLHVPLMLKRPQERAGRVVDDTVSHMDLFATLLVLAGGPAPSQGFADDLLGGSIADRVVLVENSDHYPEKYLGVRMSGWKYLRRNDDGTETLFDLRADPGETHDLAAENPGMLQAMRENFLLAMTMAEYGSVPNENGVADDAETLERLKSLGYVH